MQNASILFSKNINDKIYPASLTKIMTALILLDNYNYNDYITAKYPLNYEHNGKVANIPENIEIISMEDDVLAKIKLARIGIELWRYFLYGAIILLIIEMMLANAKKQR